MKKWKIILTVLAGVIVLLVAGGRVLYIASPYRGKVIDKETKQPLEGAAVVALWWLETPMVGHASTSIYDVMETVTEQDGSFTTSWLWGGSTNPFPMLKPALFTIFKPGYEAYDGRRLEKQFLWRQVVVELSPLRNREQRLRNQRRLNLGSQVPDKKIPNLIRLRNIERSNLGLEPTNTKK